MRIKSEKVKIMGGKYSPSEENYLETLYVDHLENKVSRVKDVAQALDVKMPSVVAAIRSLAEKGLVEQEKYGHIELTETGIKVGKDVYERHKLLYAFFNEVLGLDSKVAEKDACLIEHCLSVQTRERLSMMVKFIRACENDGMHLAKQFMHFVNTGEISDFFLGSAAE
jgi:DtxR family Mn-dependent transcriptional regulator